MQTGDNELCRLTLPSSKTKPCLCALFYLPFRVYCISASQGSIQAYRVG